MLCQRGLRLPDSEKRAADSICQASRQQREKSIEPAMNLHTEQGHLDRYGCLRVLRLGEVVVPGAQATEAKTTHDHTPVNTRHRERATVEKN
jgi:hypothetical protein